MVVATSTITSKGQTTIPKKIREYLHLGAHDRLVYALESKDRIVVTPIKGTILDLKAIFKNKVKGPIDFHNLREKVKEEIVKENIREIL